MSAWIPWPLPLAVLVLLTPIGLAALVLGLLQKHVIQGEE